MTTFPTREQIEDAPPLEFDGTPKPVKRKRAVTIQLNYHDVQVRELEQSIDTLLKREGWSGVLSALASKAKAQYVDPIYDDAGELCCPVHRKPLAEGRYGLYCQCRARDGEAANDKGYCNLRFNQ